MNDEFEQYRAPQSSQAPQDEYEQYLAPQGETQKTNEPQKNKPLSFKDALQKAIMGSISNSLGDMGQEIFQEFAPTEGTQNFAKGMGQAIPRQVESGARGLAQLGGINDIPAVEDKPVESMGELAGQLGGKALAAGELAAPFAMGAEALAPAAVPEFLSSMTGAGTAGAALSPNGERLSGAVSYAAPIAAVKTLAPFLKFNAKSLQAALRKVDPEKTYKTIQNAYDKTKDSLGEIFKFVGSEAEKRGINKVGELDKDIFSSAQEFGPKTKSFGKVIENAKNGDFKSVRRLYTKLGEFADKARMTKDWEKKEVFDEARDLINSGLESHFKNSGHSDLSQWLGAAKGGWAKMKNVFESNPQLRRIVGTEREIPETLTPLMKNKTSMNRIKKELPEVGKDVNAAQQRQAFKDALTKARNRGGATVGTVLGVKGIDKYLED